MKRLLSITEVQATLLNVMVDFDSYCKKHNLNYYLIGGSLLGAVRHQGFIPWDDDMDVGMLRDDYERLILMLKEEPMKYEMRNYRFNKYCDFVITRLYVSDTYIDNPIINNTKLDKRLYFDIFPLDYIPSENDEATKHAQRVLNKKRMLSYVDLRDYNNTKAQIVGKRFISAIMQPFRRQIIKSLDKEMKRYSNGKRICSLASQYSYSKQSFDFEVYGEPKEYDFCGYKFLGPDNPDAYLSQLYGPDYMDIPPVEKRRKGWNIYECK